MSDFPIVACSPVTTADGAADDGLATVKGLSKLVAGGAGGAGRTGSGVDGVLLTG